MVITRLSKREFEVLELVAQGLPDHEIMDHFGFGSIVTAQTYVKIIRTKLGARNRAHAVFIAFKTGVLQ